jgi:UDP-N-acetylglucosamine--N-acetylmuramyl-(pentapeptide) pyrophosphoryl-undecaprenol N-acetylglucosamine transferase
MKKIMIMAAGTGGHIFPGLSIATSMRDRGWDVSWLGTENGMEKTIVPKNGIKFHALDFSGARGKGLVQAYAGCRKLLRSVAVSREIMRGERPDVVVGMGGYVTVPGGLGAKLSGSKLALINADSKILLSNKVLEPFADKVIFGLPPVGPVSSKYLVTGNSVRREIASLPPPQVRMDGRLGRLRILVVGGSLGSQALNEALPKAIARLSGEAVPSVTHQVGKGNSANVRAAYDKAGIPAIVTDFIDDMAAAYADADLVICRAGAMTVSELMAAGVGSILVPLIASTTSHQVDNARWMAAQGASIHLPQADLTPEKLAAQIDALLRYDCLKMAMRARSLAKPNALQSMVEVVESMAL